MCKLNRSYFSKIFKQNMGCPPQEFLIRLRLSKAADLMKGTSGSIGDIAAQCGFQDASYFTRTFREHRGCSPAEYRRNRGLAAPETSPHPLPPDQHH